MTGTMIWVGMDVHARSTHAVAIDVMTGELSRRRFGPGLEEPVAWLAGLDGPVRACYEAGPTGYGLYRAARAAGIQMDVIAPSKTPRAPGERVKTDARDAELLARLLMAGSLTAVAVPPPGVEAARDLVRAHDACRRDLMSARHRISKLLLRHGQVYPEASTWTVRHRDWLGARTFDEPATELAFSDALCMVDALSARKAALAHDLARIATDARWWPTVARLRAFHGIDTLSALALHLEIGGEWSRFDRPAHLASWLGLTPSRTQSGESERSGSITKTGSGLARRLLVEAAWHAGRPIRSSAPLRRRQEGQPAHILQIAQRARRRLHHRHHAMRARAKPHNVIAVALARELSGFLWAAATADP